MVKVTLNKEPRTKNTSSNTSATTPSTGSGSTTMADLLKSVKTPFVSLKKGEVIKGTITKLTPHEILLDIAGKTDSLVLEKDKAILRHLLSVLKVGDTVNATVLNPESDMGYPVVSLRRFLDDLRWEELDRLQKSGEKIMLTISAPTRGGFLASTPDGVPGFLPNSQVSFSDNPQEVVGKKVEAVVLEINRAGKKVIFSQKAMVTEKDFGEATQGLKIEQKISAVVTNIAPFGIFVSFPVSKDMHLDGLIHISEVAWEKVANLEGMYTVGQTIEGVIIGFDKEAKRIDLSIKRLSVNPFEEAMNSFSVDQKVVGKVTKTLAIGVLLEIGDGIEGLIRKDKIPPTVTYAVGDIVAATIAEIDKKRQRIILIPVLLAKPVGYR